MFYWVIIGIFVVLIATTIYGALMSQKWRQEHRGKDLTVMNEYYYWKVFYANPDDPRILVSKKTGGGYTFNFANPISILTLLLMVGGIVSIYFMTTT